MKKDRLVRINELLRQEIGEYLFRLFSETSVDMSAITVTHVIVSPNLKSARVLISIRDHEAERERLLNMIWRHRAEIQHDIAKKVVMKYTPRLAFHLDTSVEEGDRILNLLTDLSPEHKLTVTDSDLSETPHESTEPESGD